MDGLYDSLMEQRLTDITVEERHSADPKASEGESDLEGCLVPAPSPDFIQCKAVKVHDHHARAHKQRQFEQRVVDHVLHRARKRCHHCFFLSHGSHEHCHCNTGQDESYLGHGGTGQSTLEIHGEQGQDCAQQHGDHTGCQHDQAEAEITCQHIERRHQDSVNTDLSQYTRKKCGCRRRRRRMGFGKPYVQREHACFGTEAEKDQHAGRQHLGLREAVR